MSLTFPIVMTMKKTLVVIKSIVKVRDTGDEVENEVINSEILNSETFFSQAFRKFSSFLLVLDLMHELCVISFLLVFHFLIWRGTCFVAYFHISTSRKPLGTILANCFYHLEGMKITRNWNCHPQLKHALHFTSNFWCAKTAHSNWKKSI